LRNDCQYNAVAIRHERDGFAREKDALEVYGELLVNLPFGHRFQRFGPRTCVRKKDAEATEPPAESFETPGSG
jgi:hypothetical protein